MIGEGSHGIHGLGSRPLRAGRRPPGRPMAFIIHGGAFRGGSHTNMNSVRFARYFAERGFVAVSIDYRVLGHRGTIPANWYDYVDSLGLDDDVRDQAMAMYPAARDAKAALRWVHAQAETYSINTDFITTIGGSAGSYLAVMLGVTDPADFRDELTVDEDPSLATTNLGADANVHTIIDHWGGISHMLILEALDGRSRFDATDAPVSIVHGTDDPTVPFSEAEMLRDAYTATGVPFAFHPVEDGRHGIWGEIIDGLTLEELAFEFIILQGDSSNKSPRSRFKVTFSERKADPQRTISLKRSCQKRGRFSCQSHHLWSHLGGWMYG